MDELYVFWTLIGALDEILDETALPDYVFNPISQLKKQAEIGILDKNHAIEVLMGKRPIGPLTDKISANPPKQFPHLKLDYQRMIIFYR